VAALQAFLKERKDAKKELTDDELTDLINKIAQIDDRVERNGF
jgi:hypothetical protein